MSTEQEFTVHLKLLENYLFQIDFGEFGNIMSDEPEPLGDSEGPNPARLLAASVANCLAASLMFAIRKFKEEPGEVTASVKGSLKRKGKRLRIDSFQVQIQLGNARENIKHLAGALEQFEEFCIVTQSVRDGIGVDVSVVDSNGEKVHGD